MQNKSCQICGGTVFSHYYHHKRHDAWYWKCSSCKTIVLDLAHWPKNSREHYGAYYAEGFSGRGGALTHFQKRVDALKPFLHPGADIFEIGAASGEALHVLKSSGFQVGGSELSARAVEFAQKNYDIALVNGAIFDARLLGASKDVVLMHHVLEHLEDPRSTLQEAYRVLKPAGTIIIEVPNPASVDAWVSHVLLESILDFPHHLFAFPPASLISLLKQERFQVIKIDMPPSYWAMANVKKLLRQGAPKDAAVGYMPSEQKQHLAGNAVSQNSLRRYTRQVLGRLLPGMVYTIIATKNNAA